MPEVSEATGDALSTGASAEAHHLGAAVNWSSYPFSSTPTVPIFTADFPEASVIEPLNVPYAVCEILVAVAAVTGNALVLAAFRRERKLRRRTNYYIVSLAAADFLVGLLGIPVAVLASVGLPNGLHACLLAVCLLVVLCTISIFCLVAVSVDRYWAILHPMAYSRNVRTKTAVSIICVCWVAGTFVGFLPLLGWNAGPKPRCMFTEVMDYDYLVFLYFATIIAPALLLAAFYAHIYRVVLRQLRQMVTMDAGPRINKSSGGSGTMLRMLGAAQRREVKATQNLAIIVLFFILCWIPLYTINCVKAFCPECSVEGPLTYFCIILSHLNSAVNPLLYAYHLRDFRAALRAIFGGDRKTKKQRHKFLHLNDDGPAITHAASAPAALRNPISRDFIIKPEHRTHINAAISSTRCLVAATVFPESLSPEGLMETMETNRPPSPRCSAPQRVMSEGCASEYRRRFAKIPRASAVSCPEANIKAISQECLDNEVETEGEVTYESEGEDCDPNKLEEGDVEDSMDVGLEMVAGGSRKKTEEGPVRTISEDVQGKWEGVKETPNGDIPMVDGECVVSS